MNSVGRELPLKWFVSLLSQNNKSSSQQNLTSWDQRLILGVVGGSVDSGSDRLSENVGFHGSVNH